MATELDDVRHAVAAFREAGERLASLSDQIKRDQAQLGAIPRQIADELQAKHPFLDQYGIGIPQVSLVPPSPLRSNTDGLIRIKQHASTAHKALADLDRLQHVLPQLVRVPAGAVKRRKAKLFTIEIEVQQLPEFWIGVTPVTNQQYEAFLNDQSAQVTSRPSGWPGDRYASGTGKHPVTGVSYQDACAFCRWAGLELPSASQWLRAARGDTLAAYPWGDELPSGSFDRSHNDAARDVGTAPRNISLFGVYDMLGTTAQWISSPNARVPERAGAFDDLNTAIVSHGLRAGVRPVRNIGNLPQAIPQRYTERIHWKQVRLTAVLILVASFVGMMANIINPQPTQVSTRSSAATSAAIDRAATTTAIDRSETAFVLEEQTKIAQAISEVATGRMINETATAALVAVDDTSPENQASNDIEWIVVPEGGGVAEFRIMRTEVTQSDYLRCMNAGVCSAPEVSPFRSRYPAEWQPYWYSRINDSTFANYPIVWISQQQAKTYARWIGGRLPSEAEWQRAAQGDDGRRYPWGSTDPDESLSNFRGVAGDMQAVGSFPAGASPFGVLDMSGNVWEWVAESGILRGGSFMEPANVVQATTRLDCAIQGCVLFDVGFRIVLD